MNELDSLVKQAQELFAACTTPVELENAKAQFLGKAGHLTERMKGLAKLDIEAKKSQGALINAAKQAIEEALNHCREQLAFAELNAQLKA
jgi:phenylalanyl-tRNA synthetase alpha chain